MPDCKHKRCANVSADVLERQDCGERTVNGRWIHPDDPVVPPDPIPVPCKKCRRSEPVLFCRDGEWRTMCEGCGNYYFGRTVAESLEAWNAYNATPPIDVASWNAAIDATEKMLKKHGYDPVPEFFGVLKKPEPTQ